MGMYEQHYLKHWGIKGMKWGVRRYQNKDGTLTELGEKRYAKDASEKGFDQTDTDGTKYKVVGKGNDQRTERLDADVRRYVNEDMQLGKEGLDSARQLTSNLKNATDASIRNAKNNRPKMDLSNMSDKEMRDAINRALLERQYNDMFAPQQSTKGRETASRVLETAGNVLAIGSSALGIALAVGKLLGKVS
jgi:hypothetical protein